jgi:single-stranded DNA-specific DHH superfamily exonuclease
MGRVVVTIVTVVAFFIAASGLGKADSWASNIMSMVENAWGLFGSAFGPVVILSLFWKRLTYKGAIAGIVAGRIKDKYYHPTILITGSEEGAKGSGRSIEGYHLFEALFENRDLFTRFGGHAMAAGLSLPVENIDVLRKRLNEQCQLTDEDMIPVLRIEKSLSFAEIDLGLAKELKALAPFGKGNPAPLFGSKGISVDKLAGIMFYMQCVPPHRTL